MHDSLLRIRIWKLVVDRHEVNVVHRDVVAVPRLRQGKAGVEKTCAVETVLVNLENGS